MFKFVDLPSRSFFFKKLTIIGITVLSFVESLPIGIILPVTEISGQ